MEKKNSQRQFLNIRSHVYWFQMDLRPPGRRLKVTARPNNLCGIRSLQHALKTQGLNIGVAPHPLNLGAGLGLVENALPHPPYSPEITPVPL